MSRITPSAPAFLILSALLSLIAPPSTRSGEMLNDPSGFQGITWGSAIAELPNLTLAETGERVKGYELKGGTPRLGDAPVESMRFVTIDGRFVRVAVRYRGKETHEQVMAYLQSQFGPVSRIPGSMVRGLNQQFNWRGPDTEINLTYAAHNEHGYLFIESRALAPRLTEAMLDIGSGY